MPSYYDIDDILMEEEVLRKVLGGPPILASTWAAVYGTSGVHKSASMLHSECRRTRKEIQADAACVDLRVRCPYFYELGCKIVPLGENDVPQWHIPTTFLEEKDLQSIRRQFCNFILREVLKNSGNYYEVASHMA
ncbi:hypothetical protein ACP4OV_027909 [Aristida adscensionis]